MGIENNIRTFFNLDAMDSFSTFCQGESHILIDKVCQDYALDESKKGISIAIVCDGHGGERVAAVKSVGADGDGRFSEGEHVPREC